MFCFLFDEMKVVEIEAPNVQVPIEGIVNTKTTPMSHYKVSLAYGDMRLIVAILRDYVKGCDKLKEFGKLPCNEIEYDVYYRNKFMQIANRISEQIEYDYDAQLKKCLKKLEKVDNSDIGEEALALVMKR